MIPKRASWQQQQQHPQHKTDSHTNTLTHTYTHLQTPTYMQTLPNATAAQLNYTLCACLLYSSVHLSRVTLAPAPSPAPATIPYPTPETIPAPTPTVPKSHLDFSQICRIRRRLLPPCVAGCEGRWLPQGRLSPEQTVDQFVSKIPAAHTHTKHLQLVCVCVLQIFAQHIPSTLAEQIQSVKRAT